MRAPTRASMRGVSVVRRVRKRARAANGYSCQIMPQSCNCTLCSVCLTCTVWFAGAVGGATVDVRGASSAAGGLALPRAGAWSDAAAEGAGAAVAVLADLSGSAVRACVL